MSNAHSPEMLALYGLIDAELYLKLTDAPPLRTYSDADKKHISDSRRKWWAEKKSKQSTRTGKHE